MIKLRQVDEYRWEIPREGKMRTRGLIFASKEMIPKIMADKSLEQVANVATLPGIVGPSMAMPDIHWGYGFPIGGVAAFSLTDGVVSPGGVGYDINCGVRLLRTNLQRADVECCIEDLVNTLFRNIPSGVGSRRKDLKLSGPTLKEVMRQGAGWAVKNGYGSQQDLDHIEAHGRIDGADPDRVSQFAMDRGKDQLGTLGSGNHFVEVGYVLELFDEKLAAALGLFKDQVTAIVHTGSRGLGHQVCDDYIKVMLKAAAKYGIELPDRQLCCAPLTSPEAKQYLGAMASAANFAFANRQLITHWVRESFEQVFKLGPRDLGLELVYDVAHNIAKIEEHTVDGKKHEGVPPPQGRHPGLSAGPPGDPGGLPEDGPAGADSRRYGAVFVCFGGDRKGADRNLRQHLPRGGPGDEPAPGPEGRPGPLHHLGAGEAGHHRPGRRPGHHRRRRFPRLTKT